MQRLTVSLRGGFERRKGSLVFHFTGQLDAYSEKQFITYLGDILQTNNSSIVVDLTNIDFLDSSGLGALVQIAKKCNLSKRQFFIVGNSRVVQTIKLVRLEGFLNLAPDLSTALKQLAA